MSPGASRDRVEGWVQDADGHPRLRVRTAAPPEKGKANKAVLRQLAKVLGVAVRDMDVVRGDVSRNKTIRITLPDEAAAAAVKARLSEIPQQEGRNP